jgi:hypothetical protein
VSADAVVFVELSRPAALLDRASDARLRALADAVPGFKKGLENEPARKLREGLRLVAERLGKPLDEALRDLTGGGAVLAVEAPEGGAPGAFLVVTPADAGLLERASRTLIELARQDAADHGRPDPVKSAEYRGITGYAVGPKVSYAVVQGKLVIADRADTLKAVVDRALDGLPEPRAIEGLDVWKARRGAAPPDALAWGFARLDRLRALDPKKFQTPEKTGAGPAVLFGGWLATLRQAPWVAANVRWTDDRLAAELTLPAPKDGRSESVRGFIPPENAGAPALAKPPGTVLSLSLWRDLAAAWEARAELVRPEDVQNLAKLDTFAGQFFGGRDFGSGVLGATTADWRLVVALQDYGAMKPAPDVKLPAVALVIGLKPDDDDFAQRLKVAFQSFIGLANLGAAQAKAPPLELVSETFEGVTISTTRFIPQPGSKPNDDAPPAVHYRHNYSPTAVQVGDHFVISSSLGLARDLVKALKTPAGHEDGTLVAEADGATLAKLVGLNRDRLVMQNILEKGNDQARAEGEVDLLAALLRYLGHGRLAVKDGSDLLRLNLEFQVGK